MFELRQELDPFLSELSGDQASQFVRILRPRDAMQDSAFLVDILRHLNRLNFTLQGKEKTICELWNAVKSFMMKVDVLPRDVETDMIHFATLA